MICIERTKFLIKKYIFGIFYYGENEYSYEMKIPSSFTHTRVTFLRGTQRVILKNILAPIFINKSE